jgi:hypothetical protein
VLESVLVPVRWEAVAVLWRLLNQKSIWKLVSLLVMMTLYHISLFLYKSLKSGHFLWDKNFTGYMSGLLGKEGYVAIIIRVFFRIFIYLKRDYFWKKEGVKCLFICVWQCIKSGWMDLNILIYCWEVTVKYIIRKQNYSQAPIYCGFSKELRKWIALRVYSTGMQTLLWKAKVHHFLPFWGVFFKLFKIK